MAHCFAVRAFQYEADPVDCDRWCHPSITFERGRGDCDDWALLVASVLVAIGVRQVSVVVGTWDGVGHAWVEGLDHHGWFHIEATSGALASQRPLRYRARFAVTVSASPSEALAAALIREAKATQTRTQMAALRQAIG